jgi:hypothetical protein
MQRAFGKSAYKTVFLLTILTMGLVFAVYTVPVSALNEPDLWVDGVLVAWPDVTVGQDDIAIEGTGAAPFANVEIYWDEISDDALLTTATADSTGAYETDEEDFEVPETAAGTYYIIVVDGQTLNNGTEIEVVASIELDPEEGLPDDEIDIEGLGFGDEVELVSVIFDYYDDWGLYEDVMEGFPDTDENGTVNTSFEVPDVDEDDWPATVTIYVEDEDGNSAEAEFVVGQYIHVDPDEGYPTWGPVEWDARAEANTDYEVVFVGVDLWISLENVTSDDDGEMSGEFDVPYEAEPGDGPEPLFGHGYTVELWDEDDEEVASTDFTVYPEPELITEVDGHEVDGARANETVELYGWHFTREEDTEVEVTLDGIEIGTFETNGTGYFEDDFRVPNIEFGHYTLYAVDENGYEAELDFDVRPEGFGEMGTRNSVYFQGDHISFWVNTTDPMDDEQDLVLFVNITDPDGVLFWSPCCELIEEWHYWRVDQLIEGEYTDYYVMSYCEHPWKMQLPDDVTVGTWNWTAYDTNDFDWDEDDWDVWAEGTFEVVDRLTLDLVLDRLDEMEATIVGLFSDTEGNLMAYIDTKAGTVTASLADLNAKVVDVEGDTATLVTDLGMVKADVADIADEFPLDIPTVDLTPMWAAVALSLIAAIAAIAAVVIVYQRIA